MPASRLDCKSCLEPSASRPKRPPFSRAADRRVAARGQAFSATLTSAVSRLLIATTNGDKLREIAPLLAGLPFDLVTLGGWPDMPAPLETGGTFAANARAKAIYYAQRTGELTVAEDSGLEIDALGGAPGVESARFGGVETTYPEKFG